MVMERFELRPFEQEIIERYSRIGKGRGWKGVWIRGHLQDVGSDWPYVMWGRWWSFTLRAERAEVKIKPGTYQSFRTYIYTLKKLGLIRPVPALQPDLLERVMIALGRDLYEELAKYVNRFTITEILPPKYTIRPGRKPYMAYEIVPERKGDPAWRRPFQEAYPSTDWTVKTGEEKRRLRLDRNG